MEIQQAIVHYKLSKTIQFLHRTKELLFSFSMTRTVEEICDFDQQFLFDEYVAISHHYDLKRYHRKAK
jgi:hypothetical protein